jgi:hypothetical protein
MFNRKTFLIFFFFFIAVVQCLGHTINYDFSTLSKTDVGFIYLKMGYTHILPFGLDHVLFVLGLFFLNPKIKSVIWQATAFTIAHSITLGLAIYGFIHPLSSIIESIIALSILFLAIENILHNTKTSIQSNNQSNQLNKFNPGLWRILIVFAFGLIHGCGFASALTEVGLPENNYLLALATFNIGVELGQITVIFLAWMIVGKWFSEKPWYRKKIVIPVSVFIGCVALYWTLERTFSF